MGKKKKCNYDLQLDQRINYRKKSFLVWGEHCTECAVPVCYGKCAKYRKRKDGRCRLFKEEISKVSFNHQVGYEIYFEGWAKLESFYRFRQHSKFSIKLLQFFFNIFFPIFKLISTIFEKNKNIWKCSQIPYKFREFMANLFDKYGKCPDCFAIQVLSEEQSVNLILEVKSAKNSYCRKSLTLKKGINSFFVYFDELKFDNKKEKMYIFIYPDKECKLTFLTLDFATLDSKIKKQFINENLIKNNVDRKKIKCVVWDLDNTLWDGILIEGKVKLRQKIANIIKDLDSKGIVNSVVSKNNFDEAYNKLKEFGLDEYIIMPHINWIPKSVNIKNLVKNMNIGIDTVAFVDDSPFELGEVESSCPEVLGINVLNIDEALKMNCFDVMVTEDSKNRRNTYRMMEKQLEEMENWDGNIDDFLKSCNMVLKLSEPSENEIERCYELIQRTNQLNSSGRRLDIEEIKNIISNKKNYSTYVLKCVDKCGDYGLVGFSIIEKKKSITITDFVISCRVANKKVEHTFIQAIYDEYYPNGDGDIYMNYKKTVKNGPIFKVVTDLNMKKDSNNGELDVYKYNSSYAKKMDIIKLEKK